MNERKTEVTLRADVKGSNLSRIKLPDPIKLTRAEAETIAIWARPFSGTCLTDMEILVNDIRPSSAVIMISELPDPIAGRILPLLQAARRHGFGLRIMQEVPSDPYEVSIFKRTVDVPQLTLTERSIRLFLEVIGYVEITSENENTRLENTRVCIDEFARRLSNNYQKCLDAGVAHYREYCTRIVEYGKANGADEIIWGRERRAAVPSDEEQAGDNPANDNLVTFRKKRSAA